MKTKTVKALFKGLHKKLNYDGDPFLFVHFSKEDDYVYGASDNLDSLDALIIIRDLIRNYGLNGEVIAEMANQTPKK